MKTIKQTILSVALCALAFVGCTEGDKLDYGREVLLVSGTESSPLVKFTVEDTPSTYMVTASTTGKVSKPINVEFAIDYSLVDQYNAEHGASYYAAPDNAVELVNPEVAIETGKAASAGASVRVVSTEDFVDGRTYIIPVTIKSTDSYLDVLESSRTIYLRISRVISFNALDMSNTNLYSNFIFADDKAVEMNNYTYEIKCYINEFHTSPEQISRLCSWTAKDESKSNMLRFGENGQDIKSLQWVNPAGGYVSKTLFQTKSWYTISLTYDGSTLSMYINGVKDGEMSGSAACTFQRMELGMSWENYPSKQYFNGRIAEVRVWNRALSASEIQIGQCGVDAGSTGLVAYWKMNEGTGHIFHDATGNGYDMDWSNTVRDNTGNGILNTFDKSAYVNWLFDDNNKCSN